MDIYDELAIEPSHSMEEELRQQEVYRQKWKAEAAAKAASGNK
jgi:hypothetical protein